MIIIIVYMFALPVLLLLLLLSSVLSILVALLVFLLLFAKCANVTITAHKEACTIVIFQVSVQVSLDHHNCKYAQTVI